MHKNKIYFGVGLLVIVGFFALLFIIFNASSIDKFNDKSATLLSADFDNISGLREKSPVRISGVTVGNVASISLDNSSFRAHVILKLNSKYARIPVDSEAHILTEGLLGGKYIGIELGLSEDMLPSEGKIERTVSAMVLENLIGKLVFSLSSSK